MKANIILMNILLSKVAYLAILSPHRKLLVSRVSSEKTHKSKDRMLIDDTVKIGLSALAGLVVGYLLISGLLRNFGGIRFKEKMLTKLEKEGKLKTRHLVLGTYSSVSKILNKSGITNNSLEKIIKNKKIWNKFLSNKQLIKKTMRIGNIGYINLMNQPVRIQRKLVKNFKSELPRRQLVSRKLGANGNLGVSCDKYFCIWLFLTTFVIGGLLAFIIRWNEEYMINSQLNAKLKMGNSDDSSDSRGRKLGVLSDLVKQIGSFTALNSQTTKKNSGSNFIQNLGVNFLTGQSNKKQKKIANIFSKIINILPQNIKNIVKRGTFR